MDSIDLIRANLRQSEEIVLSRIEEMRDHAMVCPTPRGGCHTLWILGHLAYIEGFVIHGFMLGEANPLHAWEAVFDGADVSHDAADYPPFDRVLGDCRAARARTIDLLGTFSEADLDQPARNVPAGAERLFETYRHCLQYVADHWYMHRGQLADARRAAGIERMWF